MRETYLNFPLEKQAGLPSGSTLLLNAFNQIHAQIWFNCFIILGILGFLFHQIRKQQFSHLLMLETDIIKGRLEYWSPRVIKDYLLAILYPSLQIPSKLPFTTSRNDQDFTQNNWPHVYVNPYIAYENWLIELLLLFIPFILIASLCIPSTSLAYSGGEVHLETASIKVTGHQWYWENNVTFPVTILGYPYNKLNELSRLLKDISLIQDCQATVLKSGNFTSSQLLFLTSLKRQYFIYNISVNGLTYPATEHSLWLNFSFSQTDLPLQYQHELVVSHRLTQTLGKISWLAGTRQDSEITHAIIKGFPINFQNLQQQGLTNIATPIPAMAWSRIVVDSADVIHSLWLWDYGIKLDCIPGNALQCYVFPKTYGISLGSCAEYCGTGHINMSSVFKGYDSL